MLVHVEDTVKSIMTSVLPHQTNLFIVFISIL